MREIAIVAYEGFYEEYGDTRYISDSITDWFQATEEEYLLLVNYCTGYYNPGLRQLSLIERIDNATIAKTVSEFIEEARKLKEKEDEAAAKRKITTAQKAEAKLAKEKTKAVELALKHGLIKE